MEPEHIPHPDGRGTSAIIAVVYALAGSEVNAIVRSKKVAVSTPSPNSSCFAKWALGAVGLEWGRDIDLVSVGSASDSWTVASWGIVEVAWTASLFDIDNNYCDVVGPPPTYTMSVTNDSVPACRGKPGVGNRCSVKRGLV